VSNPVRVGSLEPGGVICRKIGNGRQRNERHTSDCDGIETGDGQHPGAGDCPEPAWFGHACQLVDDP
jgi:hypothetical protein